MLVESPIGRLDSDEAAGIDWLDLTWVECGRRALRKITRGGRELRILLRLGITLFHRDMLWRSADGDNTIAVHVIPADVLILSPTDAHHLAAATFELGNLHAAVELLPGNRIATAFDGPALGVCEKLKIPHEVRSHRFQPTFRGTIPVTIADELSLHRRT